VDRAVSEELSAGAAGPQVTGLRMTGPCPLAQRPVGIFDSGVGGLTVWREIRRQWPAESCVYVADQAHVPYGPQPPARVRAYAEGIVDYLLLQGCKAIVVACNTASAAALQMLRARHPQVPFVGMEPAVKPAALATRSGVVAVLGTPVTLQGELLAQTAQRFAQGVRVIAQPCLQLVESIEAGDDPARIEVLLQTLLAPAVAAGADHVVLACTHFPFAIEQIQRVAGAQVTVIDPSAAVARQLGAVLAQGQLRAGESSAARQQFASSGPPLRFAAFLQRLLGMPVPVAALRWQGESLQAVAAAVAVP
jgi:glutamate racemase